MDRRGFFAWLSSSFAAGTVAAAKPEPCLTPAYAGFDGTMRCGGVNVILRRGLVDNPHRYTGLRRGEFAVWNNTDKSVSKLLYRNADGKLFDLLFVPMDEPSHIQQRKEMP